MKMDDKEPVADPKAGLVNSDQPVLLRDQVFLAISDYLTRLDGEEVSNLYSVVLHEVEMPLIQAVLERCGQNQSKAAQMLGLSRSTLRKKMNGSGHL
jgi:Fis family transcriptional regulator